MEAFRAIYIDFEGLKEEPPSLIGIATEYHFRQVVLSPTLKGAADAKGLRFGAIDAVAGELVQQSEDEDRRIVGYSQFERQGLEEHGLVELGTRYRDARMIGRRWINRLHPGAVSEWRLVDLLRFIGYDVPRHLGKGNAAKRIRDVSGGLAVKQGDYSRLTGTQKGKWTKLLEYNRIDCLGMRDVVLRAASEITVDQSRA